MPRAVSCRLPTEDAQIHFWDSPCRICGRQSWIVTCLYARTPVFPCHHSSVALHPCSHQLARWTVGPLDSVIRQRHSTTPPTENHTTDTFVQRSGAVVITLVSFLWGLGFKYRLANCCSHCNFSCFPAGPLTKLRNFSASLAILSTHHSFITALSHTLWSEVLKPSLNKPRITVNVVTHSVLRYGIL
jgi:hypothetical protein